MAMYQERERRILDKVAQQLGLKLNRGSAISPSSLTGEVDGHPVKVMGLVDAEDVRFGLWASFVPPLDLGLQISRRNTLSMIAVGFSEQSDFDLQFEVKADEPARAQALMVPSLQSALLSPGAIMEDRGLASSVIGEGQGGLPDLPTPAQIVDALRSLVQVAMLAEQSCRNVPEASVLAGHAEQWAALASRHELELSRTPLQLKGRVGRTEASAGAQRTGKNTYSLTVSARFESPLGIGLSVRREGITDKLLGLVKPDIRFADAEFDPLYRVAAAKPEVPPRILDSETRALLSSLARRGLAAQLSDEAVAVAFPSDSLSPEASAEVFDQVTAVANRVQENALGVGRDGPYR